MKKITKAVICCAGMGTRFLPATKGIPKELFPIIDKPNLQYIIEECIESGIKDVYLITNPLKPEIKKYFERNEKLENHLKNYQKIKELNQVKNICQLCNIHYIEQLEPKGSGHAVYLAKNYIKDNSFAVLYGDDLTIAKKPVLKQLIELYEKYDGNIIGAKEVLREEVNRYGIIEFENGQKIKSIIEKPEITSAPSNIAISGRYIFKSSIFEKLEKIKLNNKEYQLTDAIKELMKDEDFYACKYDGEYYDIGNKIGFIKAIIEIGLKRDDIKEELEEYLKNKF